MFISLMRSHWFSFVPHSTFALTSGMFRGWLILRQSCSCIWATHIVCSSIWRISLQETISFRICLSLRSWRLKSIWRRLNISLERSIRIVWSILRSIIYLQISFSSNGSTHSSAGHSRSQLWRKELQQKQQN